MLEEAGGEQHNITQAAPNQLKLGEVASSDESWPSAGWRRRGVFVRHRLGGGNRPFGDFWVQADTHTFRIPAGEAFRRASKGNAVNWRKKTQIYRHMTFFASNGTFSDTFRLFTTSDPATGKLREFQVEVYKKMWVRFWSGYGTYCADPKPLSNFALSLLNTERYSTLIHLSFGHESFWLQYAFFFGLAGGRTDGWTDKKAVSQKEPLV